MPPPPGLSRREDECDYRACARLLKPNGKPSKRHLPRPVNLIVAWINRDPDSTACSELQDDACMLRGKNFEDAARLAAFAFRAASRLAFLLTSGRVAAERKARSEGRNCAGPGCRTEVGAGAHTEAGEPHEVVYGRFCKKAGRRAGSWYAGDSNVARAPTSFPTMPMPSRGFAPSIRSAAATRWPSSPPVVCPTWTGPWPLARPRAIFVASEVLLPSNRRIIEQELKCRVRNHYGQMELACSITEQACGRLVL